MYLQLGDCVAEYNSLRKFCFYEREILMFTSTSYAQSANDHGESSQVEQPNIFVTLAPFILIFFAMYFLLIRPQQKRIKEHKNLVDNLKIGDSVVTGAGIVGRIKKIFDGEILIEVAKGVEILFKSQSVISVIPKDVKEKKSKEIVSEDLSKSVEETETEDPVNLESNKNLK